MKKQSTSKYSNPKNKIMDWNKLLSKKREIEKPSDSKDEVRSEFEKDADRIFFSYPFRRMQNKTQVIPVPVYDFIHTRLTHSLEVATIGNSLGRTVGGEIIKRQKERGDDLNEGKNPEDKDFITEYDFGAIVKAACLAHDIGNPPFGHSGEKSISDFFKGKEVVERFGNHFLEIDKDKDLNEKRWKDFQNFEGNAMGFRIITNEHYHGFNLTYATLATFAKYPHESMIDGQSQKKFGFFQSERDKFKEVAEEVGLLPLSKNNFSWCRHPLAFLVEAADDICNTMMDLEDSYRIGKINERFIKEKLILITGKEYIKTDEYKELTNKEKIGYLRGKAIFKLVDAVARLFLEKEKEIMKGEYMGEFVEDEDFKYKGQFSRIYSYLCKNVYKNYKQIQELEVIGSEVLRGLLGLFVPVVVQEYVFNSQSDKKKKSSPKFNLQTHYEKQLLIMLPKQFQLSLKEMKMKNISKKSEREIYEKIMRVIDFVSGMTDTYALQLYRKLKGIDIPHLQNLDI